MVRRTNWGEDRVFCYDPQGALKSFPANVTDVVEGDAFARVSAGKSAFRVDDLLELRDLLDQHALGSGGDQDV